MNSHIPTQFRFSLWFPIRAFSPAIIMLAAASLCSLGNTEALAQDQPKITYDEHIKPIFRLHCSSCHGGNSKRGDLDVMNFNDLMAGGSSGESIEPGYPEDSYLLNLVTHEDTPVMPPSGNKIPADKIKMITQWIQMGALENSGSKAAKAKPRFDMAMTGDAMSRPEVVAKPMRLPLEPTLRTARLSAVTAIATSPWTPLAAISSPQQILLYDTSTLRLTGVLPLEPGQQATALRFSANGSLLAAAVGKQGAGASVKLFNVTTGELVTTVGDEPDTILAADISPDHSLVALGGPQKMVRVYFTGDGTLAYEISKHTDWITAIGFSPDGKHLVSGDRNGGLHTWDSETGNENFTLKAHSKSITSVSWRSDAKILASASEDSTIRLWELENGKQIKNWAGHGGGTTSIQFSREGKIASIGRDKVAKTWGQDGKMLKAYGGLKDVGTAVSYCDETKRVIGGDWLGQIRVWKADDAAHVGNLLANPPKLAERLSAATLQFQKAQTTAKPILQRAQTTLTKLEQLAGSLATTQKTQQQTITKMNQAGKQLATARQQLDSSRSQQAAWKKEQLQKEKATPLLAASLSKAKAALETLPNDQELAKSVANIESKLNQIEQRLKQLNGLVAKSDEQRQSAKKSVDTLMANQKTMQAAMKQLSTEVNRLQSEVGKLTEASKKERTAAAAAKAQVQQAEVSVQRWKGEIEFIQKLKELKRLQQSASATVAEREQAVIAAREKLNSVQGIVDQAQSTRDAAQQKADEISKKILELKKK